MSPWALLALEIGFYSVIPMCFVLLRPTLRLLFIYLYLAMVHLVCDIFWAVHGFELGSVTIAAGSVAYAAVVMTILLLVMVGHDVTVVRYAIVLVILGNVFKAGLFLMTGVALSNRGFANTYDIPPDLFAWSLRITVTGGLLTIGELLVYLLLYQWLRPRLNGTFALAAFHVGCYIGLLALDGLLFPLLALTERDDLTAIVQHEVTSKLILGIGFSIPFAIALILFRSRIPALNQPALRVHDVFVAPRDVLMQKLIEGQEALAVSEARLEEAHDRLDRLAVVRQSIADLDQNADAVDKLAGLERILSEAGQLRIIGARLLVYSEGREIASIGPRLSGPVLSVSERSRLATGGPWIESGDLGDAVCIPVRKGNDLAGVVEARVRHSDSARLSDLSRDVSLEIASLVRADVMAVRELWSERAPIVSILESGKPTAHFQPIVRLSDSVLVEYEGLIRFEPGISPEERFREAAAAGLGTELDLLAFRTIAEQSAHLPAGVRVSVNVAPSTILDPRFADLVRGIDREVTLEITEHQQIDDYAALTAALAKLPNVRLGVDDAGSGYATLQHILQLRPAVVKLDMSWVKGVSGDPARQALIRALASFAHEVGATLTAEGIEVETDAKTLAELGVRYGQGYLYGRPVPVGVR